MPRPIVGKGQSCTGCLRFSLALRLIVAAPDSDSRRSCLVTARKCTV